MYKPPISVTGCASLPGASLNDDGATSLGKEYNWSSATNTNFGTGFGAPTNTRAIVEIGGQCWARYNLNATDGTRGDWYYPEASGGTQVTNQGFLYNWNSAMYNTPYERGQGFCPNGWHVPSDCEWMYLENTLGMSVENQVSIEEGPKSSGVEAGRMLKPGGSSGFEALLPGYFNTGMRAYGEMGIWWTSSPANNTDYYSRKVVNYDEHNGRGRDNKANYYSIRCLRN